MQQWMRRIRGAIGVGLTWGAAWFLAGMILLFIVGFGAADVPFPLFFGFLGFLAGATFSAILGTVARGKRFEELSLPRFAGWGAVGGVLLAGVVSYFAGPGNLLGVAPVFGLAGAASAAGTLALARRARDGVLPEGDDDAPGATLGRDQTPTLPNGRV